MPDPIDPTDLMRHDFVCGVVLAARTIGTEEALLDLLRESKTIHLLEPRDIELRPADLLRLICMNPPGWTMIVRAALVRRLFGVETWDLATGDPSDAFASLGDLLPPHIFTIYHTATDTLWFLNYAIETRAETVH